MRRMASPGSISRRSSGICSTARSGTICTATDGKLCSPVDGIRTGVEAPAYLIGRYSVNALPTPGELRKWISPPKRLASSRQIAKPRPVPPYLRLGGGGGCGEDLGGLVLFLR